MEHTFLHSDTPMILFGGHQVECGNLNEMSPITPSYEYLVLNLGGGSLGGVALLDEV